MTQIAFIGLGHMGYPMAHNLLKAGFQVNVFDIQPATVQSLTAHGATAVKSVSEAAKGADVIITMLQTGQQVSETCLGADGIFAHAKSGVLYVDSSSIEITTTRELHKS